MAARRSSGSNSAEGSSPCSDMSSLKAVPQFKMLSIPDLDDKSNYLNIHVFIKKKRHTLNISKVQLQVLKLVLLK